MNAGGRAAPVGLAGLVTLVVLVARLLACTLEFPPPPVVAAQTPAIGCGDIIPNLFISCNDGDPPRTVQQTNLAPLAPPADGTPVRAWAELSCELGADSGRSPRGWVSASCAPSTVGAEVRANLTLEGYAERRCGPGMQGSQAEARPQWTLPVSAGPTAQELLVFTEATMDLTGRCDLTLDGRRIGDVRAGRRLALHQRLEAGTHTELVLDCSGSAGQSGLAVTGCFGYVEGTAASPPFSDERVLMDVRLRAPSDGG